MTWPAMVLWALILLAAFSRGPALLYLFNLTASFGTLQMVPGELVGGANVLAQSVCAVLLVAKVLTRPGNTARALACASSLSRMGLFAAFTVYALLTALVLPRLFLGRIEVVPISAAISGATLVAPTAANVTQSGYMLLSFLVSLVFAMLGDQPALQRHYLRSLLLGGVVVTATGLLDLGVYYAGAGSWLEPFRNVSYSLLTDVESAGSKRVVGLMPEASAYGSLCVTSLAFLTFLRPCYEARLRNRYVTPTIIALLAMTVLSTSSSAYAGLAAFGACYGCNLLIRFASPRALNHGSVYREGAVLVVVLFVVACILGLMPSVFDPLYQMFDSSVLQKSSSASFIERSMWTRVGWDAFVGSGMVGVGLGAVRTSNWFVCILASTGAFGGALLFGFILRVLVEPLTRRDPFSREMVRALRLAALPSLVVGWLGATTPDMGVTIAAVYGLLSAHLSASRRTETEGRPERSSGDTPRLEQARATVSAPRREPLTSRS